MPQGSVSRADLHCHSTASATSRLGVQRAVGLPECATPPEEVYALAKRRGMDFVTITDHDTIAGVGAIADRPDVFVSEELTARFRGEPRAAVHVLCWGIDAGDHEWLQAHADDVGRCAAYLHDHDIACALAHPYYFVDAPLRTRHLRALSEMFGVWEARNGSRPAELNAPAAIAAELRGLATSGGSDDHGGVDVARTWTETPHAGDRDEFLAHLRTGGGRAGGAHGGMNVWAHAPIALALRTLDLEGATTPRVAAVVSLLERLLDEGQARQGGVVDDSLTWRDGRDLLATWLDTVGIPHDAAPVIALLQNDAAGHDALRRRAIHAHERLLRDAGAALSAVADGGSAVAVGRAVALACVPALPYVATSSFMIRERRRSVASSSHPTRRVALVADALDGVDGVARLVDELRRRGVPGWHVDVVGTDPSVDRRLAAAAEIELPFYAGRRVGVPSLAGLADVVASGNYDVIHACSPGPAGLAAAAIARMSGLPLIASHHTELQRYARLRTARADIEGVLRMALTGLYSAASVVLSPSTAADRSVLGLGVDPDRVLRWTRGVDLETFFPPEQRHDGETIRVLYAGRLSREKGVELLADGFLLARARDPRLKLELAGDGPEGDLLRARLGTAATFLGWQDHAQLAERYRTAAIFAFASQTDTFGQVVVEAQASGLPVVAVAEGGPVDLVDHGCTGLLVHADAVDLADAIVALAASPQRRRALGAAAASAARSRTWERAVAQLAAGYGRALQGRDAGVAPAVDVDAA
jgi:glycosyltransferase involved in cell wall biosynthesis/predicted metal-dependent phosphoesterase TrpH